MSPLVVIARRAAHAAPEAIALLGLRNGFFLFTTIYGSEGSTFAYARSDDQADIFARMAAVPVSKIR